MRCALNTDRVQKMLLNAGLSNTQLFCTNDNTVERRSGMYNVVLSFILKKLPPGMSLTFYKAASDRMVVSITVAEPRDIKRPYIQMRSIELKELKKPADDVLATLNEMLEVLSNGGDK